jgi:D-apiose dehydrogenase
MTLRVALIGCGFFARNHMHAWTALPGVEVAAVCDRDPARADAFARDFGATAHTDADAMLEAVKPDLADIVTTVPSHRPLVELAARHARTVVCQKPFAETLADARAMVAACAAAGVPLLVHENFRWQRPFRLLRQAIDEDRIGTPRWMRLSFRHGFDVYANQPYLAEVQDLALTDIGLHLFDQARFLMGDIARVSCETQRRNPRVRGMDAFQALLRHTDGGVSAVDASFLSHLAPEPFPETLAVIEGDTGTLELTQGYRLRLHTGGRVTESDADAPVPAWGERPWHVVQESVAAFCAHAAAVARGEVQPQPSGAHNLDTLTAILAAIRSSETGQSVPLSDMTA